MQLPMIRIPDVIEIGGVTYVVEYVDELPVGQVALISFIDGRIKIRNDMADEVTFLSFMHEIVHGVMQVQNHFTNGMIYNSEDFTERTAQIMTSIFKQIYDYNMLYDEYIAPQVEEESTEEESTEEDESILHIDIEGIKE